MSVSEMSQSLPYPDDAVILKKYEGKNSIPGMVGNFLFYAHGKEVKCMKKPGDHSFEVSTFENDMVLGLCRHLLLNNVRIEQFKIMCNSRTRITQMGVHFEQHGGSHAYREIDVQLVGGTAVNTPGNHVSILLLVSINEEDEDGNFVKSILQTIKNSRSGVIIIASFRILMKASSERWLNLLKTMNDLNYINPWIMIHCQKHNQVNYNIRNATDLKAAAPMGGCLEFCRKMACGHPCPSVCHSAFAQYHDGSIFLCREPCKLTCSGGHGCIAECHESCRCPEGCSFLRECGHPQNHKRPCDFLCLTKLECGRHLCQKECGDCKRDPEGHEGIFCDEEVDHNCASGRHPCPPHACSHPCPPCPIKVTYEIFDCKHIVVQPCSEPFDENTYFCKEPCERRYGMCGHSCSKLCGEECGVCEVISQRPHPVCGHLTDAQCNVPITEPCMAFVPSPLLSLCGHTRVKVPCSVIRSLTRAKVSEFCFKPCDRLLTENDGDCGHYCFGNCYECNSGKMHVRCETSCGKKLLCGHSCRVNCPLLCPPCIAPCMSSCEHTKCPYECGVPCENVCKEPCSYSCPHQSCTQICGEVCDRPGCFEPCPKTLDCGHDCAGFCGEICPKGCRLCSPQLLIDFSGLQPEEVLDEHFTYICIQPCGHCVEESNLTQWMNLVDEGREIKYKCCPVCVNPIGLTLRRYSAQIQEAWRGVQEIKRKILGSEEEIEKGLEKIKKEITQILEPEDPSVPLTRFINHGMALMREVNQSIKKSNVTGLYFESMYVDKINFIQWAVNQWVKAEGTCSLYDHLWRSEHVRRLEQAFEEVFRLMMSGYWPLHPNEVHSVVSELDRVADMERLYDRLSLIHDDRALTLGNSREGRNRFRKAEDVLQKMGRYSPRRKAEFKEKFMEFCVVQNYTLNISEKERVEIVEAFGSRAGRWFKCPNGHVYVVTECGGMTELGQCNECGAIIGGEQHKLLQFNQLASEMDGAEKALWPTALDP